MGSQFLVHPLDTHLANPRNRDLYIPLAIRQSRSVNHRKI